MLGYEQERMLQYYSVGCDVDPKPLPRWKPSIVEPAPNCPRCASSNTKFCYYNNYSLSQPRYLCKACRRYWTKGGFLRNVPVGGGSRKSRRTKTPRLPQTHRPSTSNTASEESAADKSSHKHEASGSDIDMAQVFAKFLSSGQDSSYEAANGTPESLDTENDAPQPSDPITDVVLEGEGPPREESAIENFELMSGIELEWERLLGGDQEVVQDVLSWSDATTSSSSVTWQPPVTQLQEDLENPIPFNYDEVAQLPVTDAWTWNSFDFSTLQVFSSRDSRP